MNVYVVTGLELGWDCVVAVFSAASSPLEEVKKSFPEESYVIHEQKLTDIKSYKEMWG